MASDESDNNNNRSSAKNMGGRKTTSDDPINIRRRIMKVMEIGKLSKEIDLAIFYASNKDKTVMEDKLKKIRKGTQFLAIID
jgi:hypothetical protein